MKSRPSIAVGPAIRPRPISLVGTLVVAVAAAAGSASSLQSQASSPTGSLGGYVQIVTKSSRRLASAGAYPGRTVGIAAARDTSELSNVVIFAVAPATASPATKVAIRQVNEEFLPHFVAITAGSVVDFPNDDVIFHNVFSLSRTDKFDLGRFPQGRSKTRRFDQPGLIKVFCHLHSHMSALIRVFDHPFFAIPDAKGSFTIEGLPAAPYDVVAWHERVGEVTLTASVAAGRTAQLVFSLPLTDAP